MPVSRVAVASGIVGGGAPVTAGVYYSTNVTVKSVIYSDSLPWEGVDDEWGKLQDELKDATDEDDMYESIKEIKTILQSNADGIPIEGNDSIKDPRIKVKGDLVKYWCVDNYYRTIWSLIFKEEDSLINTAKKYCIYLISKKITDTNKSKLTDNNDEKLKEKLKELKSNTRGFKLDQELKRLSRDSDVENKTNELKAWCNDQYSKGFKGESSDSWKRVEFFCLGDVVQVD